MFSTDLSTGAVICAVIVAALSLTLAVLCWINARSARSHAAECYQWVKKVGQMRDPTAKIAELSAEVTEMADAYDALLKSHRKLRSRIGMRENRAAKSDKASDLGAISDKRELRLAAKNAGLLR